MTPPPRREDEGALIPQLMVLVGGAYAHLTYDWARYVPEAWRDAAIGLALILYVLVALAALRKLARGLGGLARLWRAFSRSEAHGSAGWASRREARRAGLHRARGLFVGVHEGRAIRFENETHTLVLAPAGAGKTVAAVVPQLALVETSMLVSDLKGELAAMTAAYRARRLGHRVILLNPPPGLPDEGHAYNVLQILLDDLEQCPQDAVADARALARQLYPEPAKSDANAYFRSGTRSILVFVFLALALNAPAEATLVTAQRIVAEPPVLMQLIEDMKGHAGLGGDVAAMAESLAAAASATPKEFQSFLNGAAQALEAFSPSGRLATLSGRCSFRFRELKDRPTTIYLGCDMSRMKVFGPVLALWNWAAMLELQRARDARPVLFLLDEASNFVIEGLPSALTALRGYGVRCYMVFQELEEITRVYGAEARATILSQTPLKQFFGIASLETAKMISEMLGSETIAAESFGLGARPLEPVSANRGYVARPLLTADEVRRLGRDEQIVLIGNLKPILAAKIGYHEIAPIRERLAANPFHGGRAFRGRTKLRVLPFVRAYVRGPHRGARGSRGRAWPLLGRMAALGFRPLLGLALIAWLGVTIHERGLPYLRVNYTYFGNDPFAPNRLHRCLYWGWGAFERPGPDCPIVVWRKPR